MSPNPERGGAIASVVLAVFVLAVVGIASLVATGFYVANHTTIIERGAHTATVETPFGNLRVRENDHLDPSVLGVPVYPGAVREEDSHKLASFHLDIGRHHKDFAFGAASYRTPDSVDRVTAYYRDRLPHWLIADKGEGKVELSFTKGGYRRFVAISRDDEGETHIGLASVGEPASN